LPADDTRGQQAPPPCVAVRVRQAGRVVRVPGSPATGGHVVGKRNQSLVSRTPAHARVLLLLAAAVLQLREFHPFDNYDAQVGALKLERSRVPLLLRTGATRTTMPDAKEARISVSALVSKSASFSVSDEKGSSIGSSQPQTPFFLKKFWILEAREQLVNFERKGCAGWLSVWLVAALAFPNQRPGIDGWISRDIILLDPLVTCAKYKKGRKWLAP